MGGTAMKQSAGFPVPAHPAFDAGDRPRARIIGSGRAPNFRIGHDYTNDPGSRLNSR